MNMIATLARKNGKTDLSSNMFEVDTIRRYQPELYQELCEWFESHDGDEGAHDEVLQTNGPQ